ncbi:hypothetical protein JI739_04775 [Ramlibacter sp. AW1]|uniref:Cupin domain-containing protein n=1 Tax=Ramlibacter aurantiacus TaxID=2801330 RepID=A0A936ZLU2_9BURK|nr:hypothetical protein [Ramlibacter aurantiacus]MBL0419658.1 hypothetical protein [Ramlibacter aurantiacus]
MTIVREAIDAFPFEAEPFVIERREDLLLSAPLPHKGAREPRPPLQAAHFAPRYIDQPFVPPRGVYESEFIRVEWQTMDARQPFYHRNCGVDELSFQVDGDRTLMTELGSVELRPGDFTLLPDGVAHDNFGRRDIHLLFYVPGGVVPLQAPVRESRHLLPPFEGWQPAVLNELVTQGLAGPGQDVVMAPVDERLLLEQAARQPRRLQVLRAGDHEGTHWLYQAPEVRIGMARASASDGTRYTRHRDADELHYQVSGTRTLVTQRGCIELQPGDFVCVPRALAFTSIHHQPSSHLVLASRQPLPLVAPASRTAERFSPERLRELRGT